VRIVYVRRILKILAVLLGEDEGRYMCIPASSVMKVFDKIFNPGSDYLKNLFDELSREGTLKIQKFGRGFRICIVKDDEFKKIKDFIFLPELETKLTLEDFENLFDEALIKLSAGSVTGFVDLGKVREYMLRHYGIPEDLFVTYVQKLLVSKRWKYAMCHGGSFRLKIGNVHVGLVKLVRR